MKLKFPRLPATVLVALSLLAWGRTELGMAADSFESYQKECLARARRQGLAADVAEDLCHCTLKKFRSRYNLQQFRALVQKSKSDRAAARALAQVGEDCFEEILYE